MFCVVEESATGSCSGERSSKENVSRMFVVYESVKGNANVVAKLSCGSVNRKRTRGGQNLVTSCD